jgi:hypothetical protein
MSRRRRAWLGRLAAGSAAILLLGLAAGCSQTLTGTSTAQPQVGSCHNLDLPPELVATSDSKPPVPCTSSHTTQTFAIGQVVGQFASQRTRPDQQALQSLTTTMCSVAALRAFLGAADRDPITPVSIHAYFPSRAAWAAGARQASCDVAMSGTDDAPRPLSISLQGIMPTADSAIVRTCYKQDPLPDGTWKLTGSITTCDQPHSSQDINAWLQVADPAQSQADVDAQCAPFAAQAAAEDAVPPGLAVTGIVVQQSNGTYSLHCAIGGDSADGYIEGALLAQPS